jgi:hypothetical protein
MGDATLPKQRLRLATTDNIGNNDSSARETLRFHVGHSGSVDWCSI